MVTPPARVEIVVVRAGPGDEIERTVRVIFWSPEKLEQLLSEESTLGAVVREVVRRKP